MHRSPSAQRLVQAIGDEHVRGVLFVVLNEIGCDAHESHDAAIRGNSRKAAGAVASHTVADASGDRTFAYDAVWKLASEALDDGFFGEDRDIFRLSEESPVAGRPAGFVLGEDDETFEYAAGYHYDASGRLNRVTGPGLPAYGVAYSFLADSDMVETFEYRSDVSTPLFRVTRDFENDRNLLEFVENKWVGDSSDDVVSKYAYVNDDLARRESVTRTGAAFGSTQTDAWGYNDRNELISSARSTGTNAEKSAAKRAYSYDAIGNRRDKSTGSDWGARMYQWHPEDVEEEIEAYEEAIDRYYDTNELNQYDRVQQLVSTTDFKAYAQDLTYDADGNLIKVESYGDANCDDLVNNYDIDAFTLAVANPTSYASTYPGCDILNCDMNGDGNVNNFDLDPFVNVLVAGTSIGPVVLLNYEWDAENRLKAVWPATPLATGTSKKYVYTYDYLV